MELYEIIVESMENGQYDKESFQISAASKTEAERMTNQYNFQTISTDSESETYGKVIKFRNVNIWRITK